LRLKCVVEGSSLNSIDSLLRDVDNADESRLEAYV